MNDTHVELKICAGIQSIMARKPDAMFQEAVNASVEEARNLGLVTEKMRVRAFFTLPQGQLYVDVRVDENRDPKKKVTKRKTPSKLA
jgi:hypothetical protein